MSCADLARRTLAPIVAVKWKQFSRTGGLYIDHNDILYASDTQSNEKTNPGWQRGVRIGSVKGQHRHGVHS
jgi:hypothetical protein